MAVFTCLLRFKVDAPDEETARLAISDLLDTIEYALDAEESLVALPESFVRADEPDTDA